jgi:TldD protein
MLQKQPAERALAKALSSGGDFSEIYLEDTDATTLTMSGGKMETAVSGRTFGAGVRVFRGTNSVYVYTNDCTDTGLLKAAEQAAAAVGALGEAGPVGLRWSDTPQAHAIRVKPSSVETSRKADRVREAYKASASFDPLIVQTEVSYRDWSMRFWIANSEGLYTSDERTYTRIAATAVASDGRENQTGSYGPGRQMGFELFDCVVDCEEVGKRVAKMAVTMLKADLCPAGRFPVVIDNGFGGVIFHEACGHALEATSVAKGTSVFCGKLGQAIASSVVTAVDDATIPNAWGSGNIDDEGIPCRKTVLIEKGVLKSYLIDRLGGRRMGMQPTGSGRRQDYRFAPTSRMSNTYIAPGDSGNKDIIASVTYGLYCKNMGGGSVNPATGEFNFSVREGYMIEGGSISRPVRGATLIGKGSEVLLRIDRVGRELDFGTGMCGSLSGTIPADVGQPMVRVSEMTVGGRK